MVSRLPPAHHDRQKSIAMLFAVARCLLGWDVGPRHRRNTPIRVATLSNNNNNNNRGRQQILIGRRMGSKGGD